MKSIVMYQLFVWSHFWGSLWR